jgi:hypothetical protein
MLARVKVDYSLESVDKPYFPNERTSPQRKKITFIALFLGIFLSTFLVLIRFFLKKKLKYNQLVTLIIKNYGSSKIQTSCRWIGLCRLAISCGLWNLRTVLGFDIDKKRISDLKKNIDCTLEVLPSELGQSDGLSFSSDEKMLALCNCFIITVPTPVDSNKNPDFGPLASASKLVGSHLKIGDNVIYESTVYPGATEDECVPILEEESGLKFNSDFFVGYSPERINPGDKSHKLKDIVKVTSGSTPEVANLVDEYINLLLMQELIKQALSRLLRLQKSSRIHKEM